MSQLQTIKSNSRPTSPVEGSVFYETDTKRILVYAQGTYHVYNRDSLSYSTGGIDELHYPTGIYGDSSSLYYLTSSPIMHFDAKYIDGVDADNNPANGVSLSSWGDRSGGSTNYDLSTATQPRFYDVGGLLGVTFSTGDNFTLANSIALPSNLTQIIIATNTDVTENSLAGLTPVQETCAGSLFTVGGACGGANIRLAGTTQTTSVPTFSTSNPNIHVVTKSNAAYKYWHQGGSALYSITASFNMTATKMFSHYNDLGSDTRIHEALVFDSTLSVSDLNIIKDYANNKYSALSASTFS